MCSVKAIGESFDKICHFHLLLQELKHEAYKEAIETLGQISTTYSPMEKIDVLMKTFDKIHQVRCPFDWFSGVKYLVYFYYNASNLKNNICDLKKEIELLDYSRKNFKRNKN